MLCNIATILHPTSFNLDPNSNVLKKLLQADVRWRVHLLLTVPCIFGPQWIEIFRGVFRKEPSATGLWIQRN